MPWEPLLWVHLSECSMFSPKILFGFLSYWKYCLLSGLFTDCDHTFSWRLSDFQMLTWAFTCPLMQISDKNNSLVRSNVCFHGKLLDSVPVAEKCNDVHSQTVHVYFFLCSFGLCLYLIMLIHSLYQQLQFLVHHGQIGIVCSLQWSMLTYVSLIFTQSLF